MTAEGEQLRPRRRRRRRTISLAVGGAIIVVGLAVAGVVWFSQFAEWRDVLGDYEAAVAEHDAAVAAFDAQATRLGGPVEELVEFDAVVDALVESFDGVSSPVLPTGVLAALAALRDSHDAGGAPMLPLVAALPESPDSLSVSELEVATTWAQRNTKRVVAATEKAESVEASFRAEGAEATAALHGLVAMTVSRGLQLADARHDADEELLSALRVSLEDLALSPRASVPDSLVAVVDAAAKVVHSSNLKRIDDPSSVLVVVNKRRPLQPMSYVPSLVRVDVFHLYTPLLRQEAARPLVRMFDAFHAETGLRLRLQNSYRSYETQVGTYNYHVSTKGQAAADRTSARPGHSEHQTGLALDIDAGTGECSIHQCFGAMTHGKWLAQNSWRFGWVVRYPDGFEHVTGYHWEPWHLRYVGVEVSTAMHEQGIATLEEFFGLDAAPNYG